MSEYQFLVVEDSPVMRQLITFALSRLRGALVDEAEDGVIGLKMLGSKQYDLVIVDINMPIMNGLKLIGHIRANPAHAEVPVVVVTTEGVKEDMARALELGANAYLTKPVDGSRILRTVRRLLNLAD